MIQNNIIDRLITQFNLYQVTQPNLVACWISYLGLKKRHYDEKASADLSFLPQCNHVLAQLAAGQPDIMRDDLVRLALYKCSL
jgi:hypothetical protein